MANQDHDVIFIHAKAEEHEHLPHGTWKVAYADFVTAMMAFFILLWLLNASQEASLSGLSLYFAPEEVSRNFAGEGKIDGGSDPNSPNPKLVVTSLPAIAVIKPTFGEEAKDNKLGKIRKDHKKTNTGKNDAVKEEIKKNFTASSKQKIIQTIDMLKKIDHVEESLAIEEFENGFDIQIVNANDKIVIDPEEQKLTSYGRNLIFLIGQIIRNSDYKIEIKGHIASADNSDIVIKSKWELSGDYAVEAQKVILSSGVNAENIDRITAKADLELLDNDNPKLPLNNRISITLLDKQVATGDFVEENVNNLDFLEFEAGLQ